jgi:hypothetical protein
VLNEGGQTELTSSPESISIALERSIHDGDFSSSFLDADGSPSPLVPEDDSTLFIPSACNTPGIRQAAHEEMPFELQRTLVIQPNLEDTHYAEFPREAGHGLLAFGLPDIEFTASAVGITTRSPSYREEPQFNVLPRPMRKSFFGKVEGKVEDLFLRTGSWRSRRSTSTATSSSRDKC